MLQFLARRAGALQLLLVIGIVGGAVLLSLSLRPETGPARTAQPGDDTPVSVIRPLPSEFRPSLELNGVVEARTMTSVIPQVGGRVIEVSPQFRPGAAVKAGALLFAIDPADYELAIDRTLAEIEAARSDLALLEAEAAAEREVWASQFPDRTIPDLIARVPQIAAARARIKSALAARDAAELSLERTVVRAPFDARVLDTELDVGQVIATGSAVGTLFAVDALEVRIPVSGGDLALIGATESRPVRISTDAGTSFDGKIVRRSATLDERTRLASLFVAPAETAPLTVGEFVTVIVDGETAPAAYRLPASALASQADVWVVDNGRLALREVEVLDYAADTAIVAAFDIADGIVRLPPPNVRAGLPVRIDGNDDAPEQLAGGGGPASASD